MDVNLLILLINVVIYIVLAVWVIMMLNSMTVVIIMLLIEVLILSPVTSFVINFYINPILDKYINAENKTEENGFIFSPLCGIILKQRYPLSVKLC